MHVQNHSGTGRVPKCPMFVFDEAQTNCTIGKDPMSLKGQEFPLLHPVVLLKVSLAGRVAHLATPLHEYLGLTSTLAPGLQRGGEDMAVGVLCYPLPTLMPPSPHWVAGAGVQHCCLHKLELSKTLLMGAGCVLP